MSPDTRQAGRQDTPFRALTRGPVGCQAYWEPFIVRGEAIDACVERLLRTELGPDGRRACAIVHPQERPEGTGFAPGISVTLDVLRPGESAPAERTNATRVELCLRGTGSVLIGDRSFPVERFDVWNVPAMRRHLLRNEGDAPLVVLSYGNAALLQKLGVHHLESAAEAEVAVAPPSPAVRARDLSDDIPIGDDGARLRGYEWLVDIEVIEPRPLHWRWREVEAHLPRVSELGPGYRGRHLFVLYDPATDRRIGTTPSFFATMGVIPAHTVHTPHRHSSAAINYYLRGRGFSVVEGRRYEWQAGDLMLAAPGWAVHQHGCGDEPAYALTVQDHPLQIAMDSLIWQEHLRGPIRTLGTERGFETNLPAVRQRARIEVPTDPLPDRARVSRA